MYQQQILWAYKRYPYDERWWASISMPWDVWNKEAVRVFRTLIALLGLPIHMCTHARRARLSISSFEKTNQKSSTRMIHDMLGSQLKNKTISFQLRSFTKQIAYFWSSLLPVESFRLSLSRRQMVRINCFYFLLLFLCGFCFVSYSSD